MEKETGSKWGKEYTRNTELDEAQAEIKISRRNINNLRYADDITLMQKEKRNLSAS